MKAQNGAWDIMGVQWLFMWQENQSVDFPPVRLEIKEASTAPGSQVGDPRPERRRRSRRSTLETPTYSGS